MNKIILFILVLCSTGSCLNGPTPTKDRPVPKEEQDITTIVEANVPSNSSNIKLATKGDTLALLEPFVLSTYEILDYQFGDITADNNEDVLLILKQKGEEDEIEEELKRPLIILERQENGDLKKIVENNNVVLCHKCGGVFGDPYMGIVIKDNYFSIEHYGGSSERWTYILTFKYDIEKKNWFLHKKGSEYSSSVDPDFEVTEEIYTTKDFGIVSFKDYKD